MDTRYCDFCKKRRGTLKGSVRYCNRLVEYSMCPICKKEMDEAGLQPADIVRKLIETKGFMCPTCLTSATDLEENGRFGCSECVVNMPQVAIDEISRAQGGRWRFAGIVPTRVSPCVVTTNKAYQNIVLSSFVSVARNTTIGAYPSAYAATTDDAKNALDVINGAYSATKRCFEGKLTLLQNANGNDVLHLVETGAVDGEMMQSIADGLPAAVIEPVREKKIATLANGKGYKTENGVNEYGKLGHENDIEKGNATSAKNAESVNEYDGVSVALYGADQIQVRSKSKGFDLRNAYVKAKAVIDEIKCVLPLAYDARFGWLTASAQDIGTGLRASVSMYLPALKMLELDKKAMESVGTEFGLTIAKASDVNDDKYVMSNTFSTGMSEDDILSALERATAQLTAAERNARVRLDNARLAVLANRTARSWAVLKGSLKMSEKELKILSADALLGMDMGFLPEKNTELLDNIAALCTKSSLIKQFGAVSDTELDLLRAKIVRDALETEEK